ncbi:hypothetical protein IQ249_15305 [Lusitaniella coriacea LEGE 07157]|uniref:Uncharacterized protein n=1 Tax=Lusitaniella coriacea LEGE 07157 TaxID=945747 RepID=A0A8J7DXX9_9CYAN|nr:hypothetical protein [Lusitaniella coriacea]MBE9117267.1 hypothetical protein [Lusitaniella coriacea LEGE 07157]
MKATDLYRGIFCGIDRKKSSALLNRNALSTLTLMNKENKMENISLYERLLPVFSLALGVCLPSIINLGADLFDRIRPGKRFDAIEETLNRIADRMDKLPSLNSLTALTGQVERLEGVLSKRLRAKKTKATPKPVIKHVNGAANK